MRPHSRRACGSGTIPGELAGYRLTPRAETDLEDIWRYTAETWSPDQADRYIDALVATFQALTAMPAMSRERSEFTPPVRIHPSAEHLIVYRIEEDWLLVIRVLGGRQNWRAILEAIDG
jgi:toxin ParE1/3/4